MAVTRCAWDGCTRTVLSGQSPHCAEHRLARRDTKRQRAKRALRRARKAMQHDEATCPDCRTSLWGAPVRCALGQRLHEERQRAEGARARKPIVSAQKAADEAAAQARAEALDAAHAERILAILASRRRQRQTLSEADIWARGCGVSAVYAGGEA